MKQIKREKKEQDEMSVNQQTNSYFVGILKSWIDIL